MDNGYMTKEHRFGNLFSVVAPGIACLHIDRQPIAQVDSHLQKAELPP
jgi:hypothetical protein